MAHVIAEPCIGVKDRACVEVCPVECIHPTADEDKGEFMLFIHPEECIDCGACVPACPVSAIYPEEDLPAEWQQFTEANKDYYEMDWDAFKQKWGHLAEKG